MSTPLHPGAARSVSLWHPLGSRSTANGLVTAGALVGIAVTYPGFGTLMDAVEWQWAFIISGATLMAFALVWFSVATDNPAGHPWVNDAEVDLIQESSRGSPRLTVRFADFLGMFRNGGLALLTLSYAALSYFQYLFFYWTEYYFEKVLGLPPTESRRAAFIVTIAMGIGMAVGGYGTDFLCRKLGRRWGCRGMAMAAMGLSAAFGWLGVAAQDPTLVTVYLSLAMGSLGMCEGIFWTTAPILAPRSGGLACAFLNTGGNAGGLLAPIFTPLIGVRYGWTAAIVVACLVCGFGALLWLVIDSDGVKGPHKADD
jgi:sugar phosphate permease